MTKIKKVPDKKLHAGALIGIIIGSITISIMIIFAMFMIISSVVIVKNLVEAKAIFGNSLAVLKIVAPLIIIVVITVATIIIWLCWKVLKGKTSNGVTAGVALLITSVAILPLGIIGIIGGVLLIIGNYEISNNETTNS